MTGVLYIFTVVKNTATKYWMAGVFCIFTASKNDTTKYWMTGVLYIFTASNNDATREWMTGVLCISTVAKNATTKKEWQVCFAFSQHQIMTIVFCIFTATKNLDPPCFRAPGGTRWGWWRRCARSQSRKRAVGQIYSSRKTREGKSHPGVKVKSFISPSQARGFVPG